MSTRTRTASTAAARNEEERRKNRKGLIGVAALATSGALVLGLGYAYFSDSLTFSGSATAGTLDITTSGLKVYQNGAEVTDGSIDNFNPGDVLTIEGSVANNGSKSAWVREVVDVESGTDIGQYLYVYTGDAQPDQAALLGTAQGSLTGTLVGADGELAGEASPAKVLNGGVGAVESETGGLTTYPVKMTIYFAKEAPNAAQGQVVSVDGQVQAVQYRNNTDTPDASDWTTLETGAFTGGQWVPAP